MNAPTAINISDAWDHNLANNNTEPTSEAVQYQESSHFLMQWHRSLSTGAKSFLAIGVPFIILGATACLAFLGLGSITQAIESGSAAELAKAQAFAEQMRVIIGATVAISLVFTIALYRLIQRDVVGVSRDLIDCLQRIASGESDIVVPHRGRNDEYGELSQVTETLRRSTVVAQKMHEERSTAVRNELEQQTRLQVQQEKARIERDNALRGIADQFEQIVGDVVDGVASASSQLHSTSTMMAKTADQATARTSNVTVSMEEANSGATAAAAASDEFAMSIGEISRQAASSAELARKATTSAAEADTTITALSDSANQVGQIVELIQTIAQRTNLLALNASIEAARGGEAGRGFAVVASEVKELAMQTSRATEQVAEQIRTIQDSTGNSVTALRSIASQVHQLETTAISIASAVDQQSVAGQDLAHSIDLAARGTEQVVGNIQEVRELSVSTGAAASQVLSSSTTLKEQASTLRTQVDTFLQKVREG